MLITSPKEQGNKVFLHGYLKKTDRHGCIILPDQAVNKERKPALCSADIVQKEKLTAPVFLQNRILTAAEEG